MATNEVFREGTALSLPVPSATVSNSPVLVGALVGVAQTDCASATDFGGGNIVGNATVWTEGVFKLNVVGATTVGGAVYVIAANPNTLTATASGNTLFGYALDAQSATGVVRVLIHQV